MRSNVLRHCAAGLFLAACAAWFSACEDLGGPMGWATYTIVYHSNDGNYNTLTTTHRYGDTHTLRADVFGRVGHAFMGWARTRDGDPENPDFEDRASIHRLAARVDDVINLFAMWSPYTFTVVYNANGGTGGEYGVFENEYTFALDARLSHYRYMFAPPPDLPFFGGWATSPDGPPEFGNDCDCGVACNCGAICKCTFWLRNMPLENGGTIRLYARWVASDSFIITFDFNGGTDAEQNYREIKENRPAGRLLWLPNEDGLNSPISKSGYIFDGWNTHAEGTGNFYRVGDRFIPIDDTTLYAQWRPEGTTFTVTFNANGATGSPPPPQHVSVGAPSTELPGAGGLEKSGYQFIGWSTRPYGPWTVFTENYPFNPTDDTTLYARWEPSVVPWIAVAAGSPSTTAINFVFASPVDGLDENDILISGGPGEITTGALTGAGTSRSLAVTAVTIPGDITVSIARPGIAAGAQTVTVLAYQTPVPDIPWVAIARGFPYTVAIDFVFASPVDGLNENDILIGGGPGEITTEALTGAGTSRSLAVTDVTSPGEITVSIGRPGIVAETQTVTILDYQMPVPDAPWVAIARGVPTAAIDFVFAFPVEHLGEGDITIDGGPGAVTRGGLTGAGTFWSLAVAAVTSPGEITVSIGRPGIAAGSQTVTVQDGHVLPAADTPWVAIARGFPLTVAIDFAFADAVDGLTVADVYVAGGTGEVTIVELTGSGIFRSLEVAVINPGTVSVWIARPGIAAGPHTVTVLDEPVPDIPWVAIARGFPLTVAIDFAFADTVDGLTVADVYVAGGTGEVTIVELTGSGIFRSLEVAVINPGTVSVWIARPGVAAGPHTVTVLDERPPRDITISFADFQDAAPHIIGPTFGLLGTPGTITVLDPGGQFVGIEWRRGGTLLGTGETIVLDSNVHGNRTGAHYVTVIVIVNRNGESVPYSRIVRFEVRLN